MDKRKHNWNDEQPHDVRSGRFTTEEFARQHPEKVEWVKDKVSRSFKLQSPPPPTM